MQRRKLRTAGCALLALSSALAGCSGGQQRHQPREHPVSTAPGAEAKLPARSAAAAPWTAGRLTIGPRSLGAVRVGMTIAQASAAARVRLAIVGDGVYYSRRGPASLSVAGDPITCVAARAVPAGSGPAVVTQAGFRVGGTVAKLKAIYGGSLRYVPAPATGISPEPGYVVSTPAGNLAFVIPAGIASPRHVVHLIIGGPGALPSTECA